MKNKKEKYMRKTKQTSKLRALYSAPARIGSLLVASAVVIATGSSVLAWGPDRPTFTIERPADYVTFNSITNNPAYGDERNFVRIKEASASSSTYSDDTKVEPGKDYEVYVYFHNNASKTYNDAAHGRKGIAQNTRLRMAMPSGLKAGERTGITGYISADNANPGTVHDNSYMTATTDVALRYIPGSAVIKTKGAVNNQKLPNDLFGANGTHLGYDKLDGILPGCNEFSGYVSFKFRADAPNFTVKKQVRKAGESDWKDKIVAKLGDKIEYSILYQNTGSTNQDNVIVKDALPAGVTYVPGSTITANSKNPQGVPDKDGVVTDGLNVGSYAPRGNARVRFSATIDKVEKCGKNELVNYGTVITPNGNKQSTAIVEVDSPCKQDECLPGIPQGDARCAKGCTPKPGEIVDRDGNCVAAPSTLPQTGPAEMVLSFIGLASLVAAVAYWYKSRQDMKKMLVGSEVDIEDAPKLVKERTEKTTHKKDK